MKINLIIDGNYILNKNVFTLHKYNVLFGELHESLNKSLANFKSVHYFDNIFFVSDSGTSWRKNLYQDYKGQRKKSDDIDWEFVYTAYKEFKSDLPSNVTLLEETFIEGDDWIAQIILESNKRGYANLVISNDHDIKQLIKYSTNPLYINFMSNEMFNREKVFLPNNYEIFMQQLHEQSKDVDLFELSTDNETLAFFKRFIERREVHIVDDKKSLITKIISGDKSDNIKSVYQKATSTGKMRGIGDSGADKIYKMYQEEFGELDVNDDELFDNIADLIREVKKAKFDEINGIKNNLSDNRQLISLFDIPDHIKDQMDSELSGRFD
ncbi:MAG: RNaseH ribonuclease [uncultured marine phage]|uniref:RNaseH ribonuclease n=1 Tax=uncultured marine phage TaxID=707152 RepID=A0A8D9FRC3_9VIRU|nr:MAG: RNaseH ribonuclease [uncultured marine phage]